MKKAIITGILGQDGTLLARHLLAAGYDVYGFVRPGTLNKVQGDPERKSVIEKAHIFEDALIDDNSVRRNILEIGPDEFYHVAASHHSSEVSLEDQRPHNREMLEVNFLLTSRILHALGEVRPKCKFLFASSSQVFTATKRADRVNEESLRKPSTYYGLTKSFSMDLVKYFRDKHSLAASSAILFNHESVLRTPRFVTRKISQGVAKIKLGFQKELEIQDINAEVDWTSAEDVVRAMHLINNAPTASDYIVASGKLLTVQDLVEKAFSSVGLNWEEYTKFSKAEGARTSVVGDSNRVLKECDWKPTQNMGDLIAKMVEYDQRLLDANLQLNN